MDPSDTTSAPDRAAVNSLEAVTNLLYLIEDPRTQPADRAEYLRLARELVAKLLLRLHMAGDRDGV